MKQYPGLNYAVDIELLSDCLKDKFIESFLDKETLEFIFKSEDETSSLFNFYLHGFVNMCLSNFVSRTSLNG